MALFLRLLALSLVTLPLTAATSSPPAKAAAAAPRPRWERPPALESSRRVFESWKLPAKPRRLLGNIYYVGTSGIASYLITTPDGHILIDTGFPETVPLLEQSVRQLGFRWQDIRFILNSHAHVDHIGGADLVKRQTGATLVASAADGRVMASGGRDDFSPFPQELMLYPPVRADRIIRDGEQVTLGGVTLTAHLTPGHTQGATTWTLSLDLGERRYDVVFLSSASVVQGTRLVGNPDYPEIVAGYESTYAKLKTLPCDLYLEFHTSLTRLEELTEELARFERGASPAQLADWKARWKKQITGSEERYREQLAAERQALLEKTSRR